MKTLVTIALLLTGAIFTSSFAQSAPAEATSTEVSEKGQKKIEMKEVPEKVQEGLKKGGFTAENVKEVYEVTGKKGKTYKFIVEAEDRKQAIKFDAEGNYVGKEDVKME